jgi:hypothetical protein
LLCFPHHCSFNQGLPVLPRSSSPTPFVVQVSHFFFFWVLGFRNLFQCCKNLKFIDLSGNQAISNETLHEIKNCKHLKTLDLSKTGVFKPEVLMEVSNSTPNPTSFLLRGAALQLLPPSSSCLGHERQVYPFSNLVPITHQHASSPLGDPLS